jgi:phage antirepressor YoqD-like protein
MQNQELFTKNEGRFRENEQRFKDWLSKNEWLFATQDEKIQFILELLKQNQERFSEDETRFARNDERFAQSVASQLAADRRLNLLLELIRMDRKNH